MNYNKTIVTTCISLMLAVAASASESRYVTPVASDTSKVVDIDEVVVVSQPKEAFYLRQLSDAASICRDINNPGVTCLGDFWHMTWEETCDKGAFVSAGDYLQHVHMASRKRRSIPGEDGEADNYVEGFRGLKMIGYDKYVSYECGVQGDRNIVVPASIELLRKQWEEA